VRSFLSAASHHISAIAMALYNLARHRAVAISPPIRRSARTAFDEAAVRFCGALRFGRLRTNRNCRRCASARHEGAAVACLAKPRTRTRWSGPDDSHHAPRAGHIGSAPDHGSSQMFRLEARPLLGALGDARGVDRIPAWPSTGTAAVCAR